MKRMPYFLASIAPVAAVLVLLYRPNMLVAAAPAGEPIAQSVSVEPVRIEPMVDSVVAYGNLVSSRSVNIAAQTLGQVTAILFTDGAQVAAGQALVKMDSRIADAELQSSRAQLQTDLENLRRVQELTRQGINAVETLEQAESRVAISQSTVDINQRKFDQLTLTAPFAGHLGIHQVDVGAYISGGQTVVQLQDTTNLRIEFRMPGRVALHVTDGMPVRIQVPGSNATIVGALSFIDPSISTDTRSVLLRAIVREPGPDVRPGFYVRVSLDLGEHPHALVVPAEAIIPDLAGSYVFVVDKDNIARQRRVTLGLSDADRVELLTGVTAGEPVVTIGQFRLRDGDKVRVVPAPAVEG